jgi:hypothetical protein
VGIDVPRIPTDFVRRGNYGAWLMGMGFEDSGNALRNGVEAETLPIELPVFEYLGYRFAFVLNPFLCPCLISLMVFNPRSREQRQFIETLRSKLAEDWLGPILGAVPVVGMEVSNLKQVEKAVNNTSDHQSLLEVVIVETPTSLTSIRVSSEGFRGSVFPDGSMFGFLEPESPIWKTLGSEKFKL